MSHSNTERDSLFRAGNPCGPPRIDAARVCRTLAPFSVTGSRVGGGALQLLRQYLYFCTSTESAQHMGGHLHQQA